MIVTSSSGRKRKQWELWCGRVCLLVFVGVSVAQLWNLQVIQSGQWWFLALRNREVRQVLRAPRATILDRTGRALAESQSIWFRKTVSDDKAIDLPLTDAEALPWLATAPAQLQSASRRRFPYGPVLAHTIGYTSLSQHSGEKIVGLSGVEKWQDAFLRGEDGYVIYQRNAQGVPTRVIFRQEPKVPPPLSLTVSAEFSAQAAQALTGKKGAVIVTKPSTGEVYVAVSSPSYFPQFASQLSDNADIEASWSARFGAQSFSSTLGEALTAPNSPLLFRPAAAVYPPGSLFKIVTALAGLETGKLNEKTQVRDEGELVVGEFRYANWYWRQYGRVEGEIDLVRSLARSNDIFFYKAAESIGPNTLAEFARLFGLGVSTGWPLAEEAQGIIPDPSWKQQRFGERWFLGNTYHMGIGQGDVLVTPLQIHGVLELVLGKGTLCAPRLLLHGQNVCRELSLRPESLALVTQGLRGACAPGGTAYPFFTTPYDVLCKTGTAEFGEEDGQGHRRTHAWISVGVSRQPRQPVETKDFASDIAMTVLVESDETVPYREGSRDAGEIARKLADWWVAHADQELGR